MNRLFAMVVVAWPLVAFAEARSQDLDKAAKLIFEQKYEAAARSLEVAWRQTGNRRETVLRILELQGVVYAQLGQEAKAKAAFSQLLCLDPKRELSSKYTGKVLKPFSEALAWSVENPGLEMSAEPAAVDANGKVLQIAVKVKNDTLKLVRKVRFNVRVEGGKWTETDVDLQGAYASTGTESDGVEWFAELLGEREMVLTSVGSQRSPIKEGKLKEPEKPPPPKKDEPPPETLTPRPDPNPTGEMIVRPLEPRTNGSAAVRAIGYASLGLGFAGLAAGSVMGLLWRGTTGDLQQKLQGATYVIVGGEKVIDTLPGVPRGSAQAYYEGMKDRARIQAICANTLWGVGGGLAIVGIVLYFVGRETIPDVQPGAGGLIVSW